MRLEKEIIIAAGFIGAVVGGILLYSSPQWLIDLEHDTNLAIIRFSSIIWPAGMLGVLTAIFLKRLRVARRIVLLRLDVLIWSLCESIATVWGCIAGFFLLYLRDAPFMLSLLSSVVCGFTSYGLFRLLVYRSSGQWRPHVFRSLR